MVTVEKVLGVLLGLRGKGPYSGSRYCALAVCPLCWVRVMRSIRRCPEPYDRSGDCRIGGSRYRICRATDSRTG